MWATFPPMKLCAYCLVTEPSLGHIALQDGLKHYHVKKSEITSFPIFAGLFFSLRNVNLVSEGYSSCRKVGGNKDNPSSNSHVNCCK